MKVSQANASLAFDISRIRDNWTNGNLTDAIEIIRKLPPLAAAYVVSMLGKKYLTDTVFISRLQNEAIDELVERG
jgi:hypothetical protein